MMKRLIASGDVGDVIMVEANTSQYVGKGRETSWRLNPDTCPGGPLLQLGVHHIDTLFYLFGEISEVKSFITSNYFSTGIPDTVSSIFLFKSGIVGYMGTNYISEPAFFIRVYGTKGMLIVEDTAFYIYKNGQRKRLRLESIDTIKEQIREFGVCIINGKKPEVGIEEATKVLKVVEAIMESSVQNNKVTPIIY
ncbi:MAG: Gfo/Idh/MocA family oxidoreductase [Chloroflexi bacterium]|nr:Gfo/Idh/MocA family oxidoreductase [Chloroflexota bacterium]